MPRAPHSTRRRRLAVAAALALALLGGALAATPAGKFAYYGTRAWLADSSQFRACTPDPRILCEPGGEAIARAIAPLLPAAQARVEGAFDMAFTAPVRVQIYATAESYSLHSGVGPRSAGAVSLGVVHLAPRLGTATPHEADLITHELVHLHLIQRIGAAGIGKLPNWLWEGLPTYLSGGGGAGTVSPENAAFAIAHGRHFTPETSASLLFPKSAQAYGLEQGMYYRQAEILLAWMDRKEPAAFKRMLAALGRGATLEEALAASYGQPMEALWRAFRAELSTPSGSA